MPIHGQSKFAKKKKKRLLVNSNNSFPEAANPSLTLSSEHIAFCILCGSLTLSQYMVWECVGMEILVRNVLFSHNVIGLHMAHLIKV